MAKLVLPKIFVCPAQTKKLESQLHFVSSQSCSRSYSYPCSITSLVGELGLLKDLQQVWLFGNWLNGIIPSELGEMEVLKILQIEDNTITGNMPGEVCALRVDNGGPLLVLGADCTEATDVVCDCCTCCQAPCHDLEEIRRL
jgi:hypothetical protein